MVAKRNFLPTPTQPRTRSRRSDPAAVGRARPNGGAKARAASGKSSPPKLNSRSNHHDRYDPATSAPTLAFPHVKDQVQATVSAKVRRQKAHRHRARGVEAVGVITVNILLSAIAFTALTKLIPYQVEHRARLEEITSEVQMAEERVNLLRDELTATFDSGKSQEKLLRENGWQKRNQLTIKIIDDPEASQNTASESDETALPEAQPNSNNTASR
ncbi:hypothetical protein Pse7367_2894 [Thalassoporum mexicanum PCC 7367]|uniref:hypothetical protein n=1 Tax=Thalassoporum mexicanum TaxID=3457544 RepID=UPI00029F9152|nr:hypothetical protein [Pseudanabaena sp. PCC 7367]AFY71147.1 hypothetical protein Pse7367_2894 [Pseudanabaena sp. PCC 7367]